MAESEAFFDQHRDIEFLEAFIVDNNGVLRGKRIPRTEFAGVFDSGVRMPRSILAADVWGQDVLDAGLISETGDNDGICRVVAGTLRRVPWLEQATAQVLLTMEGASGDPFFADPRAVLQRVLARFARHGLTPVIAAEIEFYLLDRQRDEQGRPQPPRAPRTGQRIAGVHTLNIAELGEFGALLDDIYSACRIQAIPVTSIDSETGPGQFELNLAHGPDALQAADHAVLLKRLIRCVARRHGLDATFMAKPYSGESGSSMHVHMSLQDRQGRNVFSGRARKGSARLRHAIGGLLERMPETLLLLAPNANSYRRFAAGSHAPTKLTWGYDNRFVAVRVPDSEPEAMRIEHRVPGGDGNPYLVFAAILAAALDGITRKIDPGKPATGNAHDAGAPRLPDRWDAALSAFQHSRFVAHTLGRRYRSVFAACKRQEIDTLAGQVSSLEYDAYLRDI